MVMAVTLKFKNDYMCIELIVTHKYIFIGGNSGAGKSFLIHQFEQAIENAEYGQLEINVPYIIVDSKRKKESLISDYKSSSKPMLWICDEDCASMVLQTAKNRNVCCIVVTREDSQTQGVFECGLVPYSYKCFYDLQRVEDKVVLKRKFSDFKHLVDKPFDLFYTEDSGYGNRFIRRLLGTRVSTTRGKCNIIDALEHINASTSVLVGLLLDGGNIGFEYTYLKDFIDHRNLNVVIFDPECFEQLLYESPLLQPRNSISDEYCAQGASTEVYCENRLKCLTQNTPYVCDHDHGVMSPCWYIDCIHPSPCTNNATDAINQCIFGDTPLCPNFTFQHKLQYTLAGDTACPLPELLDLKFSRKYPSMRVDHSIKYNHITLCHLLNLAVERARSWMHIVDAGEDYMELGTVVPIPCYGAFFTTEEYAVLFGKDYDSFPTDLFLIDVYRNYLFPIYVDGAFIPQSGYSYNELLRISKNYPTIVI